MHRLVISAALLSVLAGCATPLQTCQSQTARQIAATDRQIVQTEENIARGYVVVNSKVEVGVKICAPTGPVNFCSRIEGPVDSKHVAIDRKAERRKLARLNARRDALTRQHAQCAVQYPASQP